MILHVGTSLWAERDIHPHVVSAVPPSLDSAEGLVLRGWWDLESLALTSRSSAGKLGLSLYRCVSVHVHHTLTEQGMDTGGLVLK